MALELERRGRATYVRHREGFEVHFLARYPDNVEQLIQVCADLDAPGTCERELRGLRSAATEHPRATAHLIALTVEGLPPLPDQVRLHRGPSGSCKPKRRGHFP